MLFTLYIRYILIVDHLPIPACRSQERRASSWIHRCSPSFTGRGS